jgi:NhaP-type Na+/H+ or K+/H+ antiporter
METAHIGLTLAIALASGVLAQSLARQLHLPGILLLLALGFGLGQSGLAWVDPNSLGAGLFGIVDFAVAIILFEGGLNLEKSKLRRQELPILQLITLGALVTLIGASLAVKLFLGWSWSLSFLFGSLVVVTGPTVIGPLIRDMRLRPSLKTILEAEGVLIDPIGAVLAILVLNLTLTSQAGTVVHEVLDLTFRLGFGILMGTLGGFLLGGILRIRNLVPSGYTNIFTLAAVFLLFHASDHFMSQSGILAVTIAGMVVGNLRTPVDRDLREFKDQLTILLVGLLFILLAADVHWEDVTSLGPGGLAVVGMLVFIIRPLNVWLSTQGSTLSWQERVFIGWVAPRGIVAAAIAALTAGVLDERGMEGGTELRSLVFLTIALTVGLAGLTARPMASLLKLRLGKRDRVAILGVEGLGLTLGKEFRERGVSVIFLDSDPKRCSEAEKEGFPVVFGDALQERTLLRAQMEFVGTTIGVTTNEHLNSMFVQQAHMLFQVPQGYVSFEPFEGEKIPDHLNPHDGKVLFERPHDIERWAVRIRHRDVSIEHFLFQPQPELGVGTTESSETESLFKPTHTNGERSVILAIIRKKAIVPMHFEYELKKRDLATVVIYEPEREQALANLAKAGWTIPTPEELEELLPQPNSPSPAKAAPASALKASP